MFGNYTSGTGMIIEISVEKILGFEENDKSGGENNKSGADIDRNGADIDKSGTEFES
jgi:hypothetical protein